MIPLFPERMLDGSIHTAILVGLLVLWFFTERLGWVYAGFIVPGYLAAIAMVAPMSLAAVVVEAILTYGVVWAVGAGANRVGLWARVFGRERFLLFVLASIPIRLLVEGRAAPTFEAVLQPLLPWASWEGARFYGIGMVLVPLLANSFWKTGLTRGMVQAGVTTGITWLVMGEGISRLTNFHFGAFEQTFEDVATDFLAAPKVYLVLVTTAFFGARNNHRYGWDFGGIMVPALLAIIALEPAKLAITLAEAVALALAYRGFVSLPRIRTLNLEGPRRLVTMYALSYGLKWCIAMAAERLDLTFQVSDAYGFGYLLTSLLALRIYKNRNWLRPMLPVLYTTGQGLLVGLGFSLALTLLLPEKASNDPSRDLPPLTLPLERSLLVGGSAAIGEWNGSWAVTTAFEAEMDVLDNLVSDPEPGALERAGERLRSGFRRVDHVIRDDGSRCLGLRDTWDDGLPTSGLPAIWWCGGEGPGLYLPRPASDPDTLVLGTWLAERADFSWIVIEGTDPRDDGAGAAATRERVWDRWTRLRDHLGDRPVAVIRSGQGSSLLEPKASAEGLMETLNPVWPLTISFHDVPDVLRPLHDRLRPGDGVVRLSYEDLSRRLPDPPLHEMTLEAFLSGTGGGSLGSPLPVPPSTSADTADLHHALARVLLGTSLRWTAASTGQEDAGPMLQWLASNFDVRLDQVLERSGRLLFALRETAPSGWGTWVLEWGRDPTWVVAAPASGEEPGTAEAGAWAFRHLDGQVLWLSGRGSRFGEGRPQSGRDATMNLEIQLLHEALQPHLTVDGEASSPRLLLVRRQSAGTSTEGLVLSSGVEHPGSAWLEGLLDAARPALTPWPGAGLEDGRRDTVSYNAAGLFPVRYLNGLLRYHALVAWLAPEVLAEIRGTPDHARRLAWYRSHGVEVVETPAEDLPATNPDVSAEAPELLAALRRHVDLASSDALDEVRALAPGGVRVVDTGMRLVVTARSGPSPTAPAGVLCTATALLPPNWRGAPYQGCWRMP